MKLRDELGCSQALWLQAATERGRKESRPRLDKWLGRDREKSLGWVPKLARLHTVFSSKDDNHPWLAEWVQGWLGTSTRPTLQCMVISRLEARQASQSQKR